ncbi:SPOR domain-containing protein [Candidatus Poribacteria bacterium]|nr:SPOR domain-containing protein [Candidatus Poribacteria bacterium]
MQVKTLLIICTVVILLGNTMVSDGSQGIDRRDIFVGASARAVGMGSAFTAGPSTNNGFLWNPSSLGFMNGLEVNMGGIPFSGDQSGPDQTFSLAASPDTLGLTNKNIGNLSVASWFNNWNNNYDKSTQIVLLGYGFALNEQVSTGANIRYFQDNTAIMTNYLWSLDLGMQFAYPLEKYGDSIILGMNLSELSNGIRNDEGNLIPNSPSLGTRFGTSYRPDSSTLLSADIAIRGQNDSSWGERLRLHFGAERWLFNNHFGFRVGYTTLTAAENFSSGEWTQGVSFRNASGQLDYAHVKGGEFDESIHWISATLRWGGTKRTPSPDTNPILTKNDTIPVKNTEETQDSLIRMPKSLEPDVEVNISKGTLELSESAISPNNDGIADSTTFRFRVKTNEKWKLTLRDVYTEEVWEMTGTGTPVSGIQWNAVADDGKLVSDGDYVLHLYVIDSDGKSHLRNTEKVTVDMIPATIEIDKKGQNSISVKTWDINAIANWTLKVYDAKDNLVEKKEGDGTPPENIVFNNLSTSSGSSYKFTINVQDVAGNTSSREVKMNFGEVAQNTPAVLDDAPKMTLMVGSFSEEFNATLLADNLKSLYPNEKVMIYTVVVNGNTMHRVTIGEFSDRSDSDVLKQEIHESQGIEPVLITPK